MADTFFVGQLNDPTQVAAATVAMPMFMFLTVFANLFGLGGAGLISRCLGIDDREKARHVSAFCIWAGIAVAFVYGVLVVALCGVAFIADSETVQYGQGFLKIICFACPTTAMNFMVITIFQAVGQKAKPLILSLLRKGSIDVVLMLLLDHLFGINGIAWATPIADWIAFVISMLLVIPFLKKLKTTPHKAVLP